MSQQSIYHGRRFLSHGRSLEDRRSAEAQCIFYSFHIVKKKPQSELDKRNQLDKPKKG